MDSICYQLAFSLQLNRDQLAITCKLFAIITTINWFTKESSQNIIDPYPSCMLLHHPAGCWFNCKISNLVVTSEYKQNTTSWQPGKRCIAHESAQTDSDWFQRVDSVSVFINYTVISCAPSLICLRVIGVRLPWRQIASRQAISAITLHFKAVAHWGWGCCTLMMMTSWLVQLLAISRQQKITFNCGWLNHNARYFEKCPALICMVKIKLQLTLISLA